MSRRETEEIMKKKRSTFSSSMAIQKNNVDSKEFTLIELLIVIAILAILAGLLLPALNSARDKAHSVTCIGNQKQINMMILGYVTANDDFLPPDGNSCKNGCSDVRRNANHWVKLVSDAAGMNYKFANGETSDVTWNLGRKHEGTVWNCPSAAKSSLPDLYPHYIPFGYKVHTTASEPYMPYKITRLKQLAETISLTDTVIKFNESDGKQYNSSYVVSGPLVLGGYFNVANSPSLRHGGKGIDAPLSYTSGPWPRGYANGAFLDGHVGQYSWMYAVNKEIFKTKL